MTIELRTLDGDVIMQWPNVSFIPERWDHVVVGDRHYMVFGRQFDGRDTDKVVVFLCDPISFGDDEDWDDDDDEWEA